MIEQVLRAVLPTLEQLGIPYILTGGIAATLHGRPRFTQDKEIVKEMDLQAIWAPLRPVR
jgi:hypothetical protein